MKKTLKIFFKKMYYSAKINIICILATLITLHRFSCYKLSKKILQSIQNSNNQERSQSHLVFPFKNIQNYKSNYKEFFFDVFKRTSNDIRKDASEINEINEENSNKKYLQKILEDSDDDEPNKEKADPELPFGYVPWGQCNLETMEVSLNLDKCGRITFNTTACSGFCKSNEQVISNTKLKKRSCWACKPYKFVNIKYEIKCIDNSRSVFYFKAISACSCFKHSDVIVPLESK